MQIIILLRALAASRVSVMGNCGSICWGAKASLRTRIREQQRKVERKQFQQELENEKLREDETVAARKLVELVDNPENAAEVHAVVGKVMDAQDKQDLGEQKLEFLRAVHDRINAAATRDEMHSIVTNAATAVHRALPPPPRNFEAPLARAILASVPPRPATLPTLPRGRIVVHRQDKIIQTAKHARSANPRADDNYEEEMRKRLERLKDD